MQLFRGEFFLVDIFNRKELEKIWTPLGALGFFMYYSPPHWGYLCKVVFDNWIFADVVFCRSKKDDTKASAPNPPVNKDDIVAEIYFRFWMDTYIYMEYVKRGGFFKWEALRGLNLLREKHCLEAAFCRVEKNTLPSGFSRLSLLGDKDVIEKYLRRTVPKSIEDKDLMIAFKATVELFEYLCAKSVVLKDKRFDDVVEKVKKILE